MSWRPHSRVRVNARAPDGAGKCDRCGRLFNHKDLVWQFDWRSERLTNLRVLVCTDGCWDEPQEQLRARILPPDPIPIMNARPEPFTYTGFGYDESNILSQPTVLLPLGNTLDGPQMLMPDGVTAMLNADNAPGVSP